MSKSNAQKERENFLRHAILVVDHIKDVLISLLELDLQNYSLSFEQFINKYQHEIFHLCYNTRRCCQCRPGYYLPKYRVLHPAQLDLLLDKTSKLPGHGSSSSNDYCCSTAKSGICSDVLDLTLVRCLLINFCYSVFWYSCLTTNGLSLENFLNQNKHDLFHLYQSNMNNPCCHCPAGYVSPSKQQKINVSQWNSIFNIVSIPCASHRKRHHTGTTSCICCITAVQGIAESRLDAALADQILQYCCAIRKTVDNLIEIRNNDYGHAKNGKMSDSDFTKSYANIAKAVIEIASVCNKETQYQQKLQDAKDGPIDDTLYSKYQNSLCDFLSRHNDLRESVSEICPKLDKLGGKIASKAEKVDVIAKKIPKLMDDSVQQISETVSDAVEKQITDNVRVTNQHYYQKSVYTRHQMEWHLKEGTFVETNALRKCQKRFNKYNVFIISGSDGTGKSRIGIELLRKLGNHYPDHDLIKITDWQDVADVLTTDKNVILLLDDVFRKVTCKCRQINYAQILEDLQAYTSSTGTKLIFTLDNKLKTSLEELILSHDIFRYSYEANICGEKFKMTREEKYQLFKNLCIKYKILLDDSKIDAIQTNKKTVIRTSLVEKIVETEPFIGFPKACEMFLSNEVFFKLGLWFFEHPSKFFIKRIDELRFSSDTNDIFSYITLVYVLLNNGTLDTKFIDCKKVDQIMRSCCDFQYVITLKSKIVYCAGLLDGYFLKYDEELLCFKYLHQMVYEAVAISYFGIKPEDVLSVVNFKFIKDIVRSQGYIGKEGEVTLILPKTMYPYLIQKLHDIHKSNYTNSEFKFVEELCSAELMLQDETDFIEQLIESFISVVCHHIKDISYLDRCETINFYFPAALLLYMTRKKYVSKTIATILNFLQLSLQKSVQVSTCHQTLQASFTYLCQYDNDVTKAELILRALKVHNIKYNVSLCLQTVLENENAVMANWLFRRLSKEFSLINLMMDIDDDTIIFTVKVLSDFLNVNSYPFIDRHKIIQWALSVAPTNTFNIELEIGAACCKRLENLAVWMLNNFSRQIKQISLIIDQACNYALESVVEEILRRHMYFENDAVQIFCKACNLKWDRIVSWVLMNLSLKINFIETEFYKAFHTHNYSIVKCLLVGSKCEYLMSAVPPESTLAFVEWLLQTADRKLQEEETNNHLYNNDDLKIVEQIMECVSDTIFDIINDHIICKNKMLSWLFCSRLVRGIPIKYLMHTLSMRGRDEIIKYMLKQFHHQELDIHIALRFSCQLNNESTIKLLLTEGDPSYLCVTNLVIELLSQPICYDSVIHLLLDYVNRRPVDMTKMLNQAIESGIANTVKLLFNRLGNFDNSLFDMKAALNKACGSGKLDTVTWMVQNVDNTLFDMKAAMDEACGEGELDTVKWLVENVDNTLFDMKSAMNQACFSGRLDTVKWLVENVDNTLFDMKAAMNEACGNGKLDTVKWLVENVDNTLFDMKAAMNEACGEGELDTVKWLVQNVDNTLFDMKSAMNEACGGGQIDTMKWMIQNVDNTLFDIKAVMNSACAAWYAHDLVMWMVQNVDNTLFDMKAAMNEACGGGQIDTVKWLVENVDNTLFDMKIVMNAACNMGTLDQVKLILEKNDNTLFDMKSAMNEACGEGELDTVKWLVENVDNTLFDMKAAMNKACGRGKLDTVKWLVQNVDNTLFDMEAAMNEACCRGNLFTVKWLVENVDNTLFDMKAAMNSACASWYAHDLVMWMVQNVDNTLFDMKIVMNEACKMGTLDQVKLILEKNDNTLFDMKSAMNEACSGGKLDTVKWLVQNVDNTLFDMEAAMNEACGGGKLDTVKWLVQNVDNTLFDMEAAINEACCRGNLFTVKWLVENVDNTLFDMKSAMNEACGGRQIDTVKWLVENVDNTLFDMKIVMNEACKMGTLDQVKLILEKNDNTLFDMKAAINKACGNGKLDTVKWLVENVDNTLFDMKAAMNEACGEGKIDTVKWLVENVDNTLFDMKIVMNAACKMGTLDQVKLILEKNDNTLFDMKTAINKACGNGKLDTVKWLVENVDNTLFDMKAAMNEACCGGELYTVKWLVQNVDNTLFDMEEALFKATEKFDDNEEERPNEKLIVFLLTTINSATLDLTKLITYLIKSGLSDSVKWLVENCNISLCDTETVLLHAIHSHEVLYNYNSFIKTFINKINKKTINMKYITNELCRFNCFNIVKWLIDNKDENCFDFRTIFNEACRHGQLSLVQNIWNHHTKECIDIQTAIIKTCRGSHNVSTFIWLLDTIKGESFDMRPAMNNACRYGNTSVVKWMWENLDQGLFDIKTALHNACTYGQCNTVRWLMSNVDHTFFNLQEAMIAACSQQSDICMIKIFSRYSDISKLDMNVILTHACQFGRTDIIEYMMNKIDISAINIRQLINLILNMKFSSNTEINITEKDLERMKLILLIVTQNEPTLFNMDEMFVESCKNGWIEIVKWCWSNSNTEKINVQSGINAACHHARHEIIDWSLKNVDENNLDLKTIMTESCGCGWLDIVMWIWNNIDHKLLDMKSSMEDACALGRVEVILWLLNNTDTSVYDREIVWMSACQNGWKEIVDWLLPQFKTEVFNIRGGLSEACANGKVQILDAIYTTLGGDIFELSELSGLICIDSSNAEVALYLLTHFDQSKFDLSNIMRKACSSGWIEVVKFLLEHVSTNEIDWRAALNLACINGEYEVVELLIDKVAIEQFDMSMAMTFVCRHGWDEIASLFIDKVNHAKLDIPQALNEACRCRENDLTELILRKVNHDLIDIKTLSNTAATHPFNESLIYWMLENVEKRKLDLSVLERKATEHKWRKVSALLKQ